MTSDEDLARVHAVVRHAVIDTWLGAISIAGGVHWQRALTPAEGQTYTRPFVSVQLRRAGELRRYTGGRMLWHGDVAIWCVAGDQEAAEALARSVAAAIPASAAALTDPGGGAGWDAETRALSPLPSVPARQQASAGLVYRVELMRRSA